MYEKNRKPPFYYGYTFITKGESALDVSMAGWSKSFFVKFAGSKGILKSCYEEIFNHITDISRGFPRNGG